MIRELHCSSCGVELTGGLDTYGDIGKELCFRCNLDWSETDYNNARSEKVELQDKLDGLRNQADSIKSDVSYHEREAEDLKWELRQIDQDIAEAENNLKSYEGVQS